jgi:hypothetical protein
MADKSHALDQLAERTGVFQKREEGTVNALASALIEIRARTSRAPINRKERHDDKGLRQH